jgi:ABC-2 type transport system ATP-binding protein
MYVREYLEFVGRIYKIKNLKARVSEMISAVGLDVEQHKKIGALSKGYRQRVGLAQAIIHDPEVLILDEPTTGLDPNQLVEIRELIRSIGKEKTVLLSTHIMQEVEAICDRVIIISKGQIVADDKAQTLQLELTHQTVYVEFDNQVSAAQLKKIPNVSKVEALNDGWLIESIGADDLRKALAQYAQAQNWLILTLNIEQKTLEEVFKELTK